MIIIAAIKIVVQPLQNTCMSIISPTLMRNNGTNTLLPMNVMRVMSGERLGNNRLSDTPQTNAPNIPSRPAMSASNALPTSISMTTINSDIGSR